MNFCSLLVSLKDHIFCKFTVPCFICIPIDSNRDGKTYNTYFSPRSNSWSMDLIKMSLVSSKSFWIFMILSKTCWQWTLEQHTLTDYPYTTLCCCLQQQQHKQQKPTKLPAHKQYTRPQGSQTKERKGYACKERGKRKGVEECINVLPASLGSYNEY